MIPLNHCATITKADGLDAWGVPVAGERVTLPCNIRQETKKTKNANGEEVVSTATILFKGYVKVDYDDILEWSYPDGESKSVVPVNIAVKRDLSATAQYTKVEV